MRHVQYVVVGGGISGATLLHSLASGGADVLLLERGERLGGVIRSDRFSDGLIERGPNTLQTGNEYLESLIAELGLTDQIVTADTAAHHRYILRGGELIAVPSNPRTFIETPLISVKGKLRLLREWFSKPNVQGDRDESIASFVERHFGREPLTYAVDPLVSGIYAGDPQKLSLRHTLPLLAELERTDGSILKGMMRRGKERKRSGEARTKRSMFSFRGGLQSIPDAIERKWGEKIICGADVKPLERSEDGWRVVAVREGGIEVIRAENVVLAVNAPVAAELIEPVGEKLSESLRQIPYAPVSLVYLLYDRSAIAHPLDGFGLLVPGVEERGVLGTIFSSTIFPSRVPEGKALLTLFVGGMRRPELAEQSSEALVALARDEAASILSISRAPEMSEVTRWPTAIPQYTVGYDRILAGLEEGESNLPGLHLLGSYRGGVSVPDCVKSACELADMLLR